MKKLKYLILKIYIVIFTTPRYDKAVYALVMCLSVHLYVTSRYCTKMATSIRLHRTRDKSLEPFNWNYTVVIIIECCYLLRCGLTKRDELLLRIVLALPYASSTGLACTMASSSVPFCCKIINPKDVSYNHSAVPHMVACFVLYDKQMVQLCTLSLHRRIFTIYLEIN